MTSIASRLRSTLSKTYLAYANTKFVQVRPSSYYGSQFAVDIGEPTTKYQVTKSPEDWKYVERLLPVPFVPVPKLKPKYPSNWKPADTDKVKIYPYYIARTKSHMVPVYLISKYRNTKRVTIIRKIQGDIWALERELRSFLQKDYDVPIQSQVNEFAGYLRFRGDHVNAIKYWLLERNF